MHPFSDNASIRHGQACHRAVDYSNMEVPMKNKSPNRNASKDFFRGFTSAFDVSGLAFTEMPNISDGPARDAAAIKGDWQQVGIDLRSSMDIVACEQ